MEKICSEQIPVCSGEQIEVSHPLEMQLSMGRLYRPIQQFDLSVKRRVMIIFACKERIAAIIISGCFLNMPET